MVEMNEAFLKKLLAAFTIESRDYLEEIAAGLRELTSGDKSTHAKWLETIFRDTHSLKGAARAVNRLYIEEVCQAAESLFAQLQKEQHIPDETATEALYKALDLIESDLKDPEKTRQEEVNAIVSALTSADIEAPVAQPQKKKPIAKPTPIILPPEPPPTAKKTKQETLRVSLDRLESIMRESEELLSVKLSMEYQIDELQKLSRQAAQWKTLWNDIAPILRRLNSNLPEKESTNPIKKLNQKLELIRENLDPLEEQLSSLYQHAQNESSTIVHFIDSLNNHMHELLMMPFSNSLTMLHKVVRDLSAEQGKQVNLVVTGGETKADRRILEGMKAPLLHLIRNSIDHGIETPDERTRKNKPSQGTISVSINQVDSGKVQIRIEDDGRGLDLESIRSTLIKRHLTPAQEVQAMTDEQVMASIFLSGFSTAKEVTAISGRGIGMSVVRENVESLNGTVHITPRQPWGTVFSIILPINIATFRGILVKTANRQFIVPTPVVEQLVRVSLDEIKTVENQNTLSIAGQVLPLESLATLLGLSPKESSNEKNHRLALVICASSQRLALEVDEVLREQEVLVKGLGPQLTRVRNISGVAVLGTGALCPILNPNDLVKSSIRNEVHPAIKKQAARTKEKKRIIVAEDSITSRMLLKNVLESVGYQVSVAVDGAAALAELKIGHFDALLSDIDMPRMNGFVLTEHVRADHKLADLPVILITSLSSQEDKERGINVGASAYIVKSSFDQNNLLAVLDRLLETG